MARLKRGFDRQALSDRQVKILSKRLAGKVRLSGFHPTLIVGIKHGGTVVGKAVAEELNVPFKEVFVKRVPAIYIDKIVHGYPRAFKNKIVSKIARSVISKTYLLFKPRTISPLKEGLSVQDRVLVVDDSAGKGPTSQEAKRHVVERGALPKNVKIGVLQIHPEYKIKERPDYFLEVGNARFPWDKASIVQSGKNPRESFKRLKKGKTRLLVLKDSAKALLDKEIEKPDLFVEKALGPKTYYGRPDSMVVGLKVPGVNRVVVKKFKRSRAATLGKVLPELLGYWGRLPENAVRMGQEFLKRGVLTPQPVALVENRVWGFWKKSFLVAEEVPEAITLSRFLRQEKDPKKQREMIRLVAKATKKMHDEGLTHGNLTLYNVWIRKNPLKIFLGDLDKARVRDKVGVKQVVEELGRFNALVKPYVTLKHRLLFWQEYAKGNQELLKNKKKFFAQIERESERIRKKYSMK